MKNFFLLLFLILSISTFGQQTKTSIVSELNVLSYELNLEPNIKNKSVKGIESIIFELPVSDDRVEFQSGDLIVESVTGANISGFKQKNGILTLNLIKKRSKLNKVVLHYEGKPKKGLIFQQYKNQIYTVFHTSEWMICNMSPNDRATISLELIVLDSLNSIANGILVSKKKMEHNKISYQWEQKQETPSYTYGFVIGKFNNSLKYYGETTLAFYSPDHSKHQLDSIFKYTADMMSFFENKSGIPYAQSTYSQIIIGRHYQEMSGFSVLKHSYGKLVLQDSTETNLISHELAHQWWGNMVTCKSWNHMWLNEGFATYLSAAYNEHRFGKVKYEADINSYFMVYKNIKSKGLDKSLVFNNWDNPTNSDRNLIYFKGAYVFHKLREELGDESFWKAIKSYSQNYYGKSVTTDQFKKTIEASSNQNLDSFFKQWIY